MSGQRRRRGESRTNGPTVRRGRDGRPCGTALVHEAYLRRIGNGQQRQSWENRGHSFAASSQAIRRILVESARRKKRLKRGGDQVRQELFTAEVADLVGST
jgi:hypothetical protein